MPNIKEADRTEVALEHSKLPVAIYIPHCLLPPLLNERHSPMEALANPPPAILDLMHNQIKHHNKFIAAVIPARPTPQTQPRQPVANAPQAAYVAPAPATKLTTPAEKWP
eukprot:11544041-Ditylum_brightwellii.AAC.1